jgi:predicted HNH restriction endonuclease
MSRISTDRQIERVRFGQNIRKSQNYPGCCEVCGWKIDKVLGTNGDGLEIHHIIPVSKGGKDTMDNTIVLCPNHHKIIHSICGDEIVKDTKEEIMA